MSEQEINLKNNLTMLTDFYELTMANGYFENGFENTIAYAQSDLVLLDGTNLNRFQSKDFLEPLENYVDISQFDSGSLVYRDDKAVAVKLTNSKLLLDMQFFIDDVYAGIMFVPEEGTPSLETHRKNAAAMLLKLSEKE